MNVIIGAGPVGREITRQLAEMGKPATLLSRNPDRIAAIPGANIRQGDVREVNTMVRIAKDAKVIYQCANAPYHRWEEELPAIWQGATAIAEETGARLVVATNVYAYGAVNGHMTEDTPMRPVSGKGRVRAVLEQEVLETGMRGKVETALVRGSDFYGPWVRGSVLGERFFSPVIAGKKASFYGGTDIPHSYTYIEDFARTMIAAGEYPSSNGVNWHVPNCSALTPKEVVEYLSIEEKRAISTAILPSFILRFAGLFLPEARAMVEMLYEFDRSFVVDSRKTQNLLGISATPFSEGLKRTVNWYRKTQNGVGLN